MRCLLLPVHILKTVGDQSQNQCNKHPDRWQQIPYSLINYCFNICVFLIYYNLVILINKILIKRHKCSFDLIQTWPKESWLKVFWTIDSEQLLQVVEKHSNGFVNRSPDSLKRICSKARIGKHSDFPAHKKMCVISTRFFSRAHWRVSPAAARVIRSSGKSMLF